MKEMEQTQKDLTQTTVYELIKGTYTPDEASEIIFHMIRKKIQFHELKNFSEEVRFGTKHSGSTSRIIELQSFSDDLTELIECAKQDNKQLKVRANIEIELK